MTENIRAGAVPLSSILLQMITGYWVTQSLYVAAKLGIADLVADAPKPIEELAAKTGAKAPLLKRVLRTIASIGVFTETEPGIFGITPLAALLRSGTPDSMRPQAIMHGEEQYRAWADVLHNVQTGETAFEKEFGTSYFGYLAKHPEADRVFNEAQAGYTKQVAHAVVDAYDFSPFKTVIDIGAGYGPLLSAILRSQPEARGILFDQPHVAQAAGKRLAEAGVGDRCGTVGGDFFVEVPADGDVYILSLLLHDWDDQRSIEILRNCRRAMPAHGKLLIVELVLPEGEEPFFGKWLDLHMLVLLGAQERTADEFKTLFAASGFALERVLPTASGLSIVEARPI
ncbi:O-methyltransferase family protein [Lysobacter antibioticus]|uniref:methyltransferase n=1 Tax=Lysobacter antibioticus TaxID=84531 RepID=UPI0007173B28|nr:methyltransferase [Lysobacter antibioticus]ALN63240.1 O-methyltransferase family protein [Lysobacter antibioticus]